MVVDTQLYDILGVSPNASQREIKQAFQQRALELHPDKNQEDPDATAHFQELNEAYDILKDPAKRREYDQFGLNGARQGGGNFGADIFSDIMGFNLFEDFGFKFSRGDPFGSRIYQQHSFKTRDITTTLNCNLEDFYNGTVKTLQVKRTRICKKCQGRGLKNGRKVQKCQNCNGSGEISTKKQIDANTVIQKINPCPICNGTGKYINDSDKCSECQGNKVVEDIKQFQVHITRGMENGEEIVFKGESDETPDSEPGDFVVTIQENPHNLFKRKFANLMIRKEITLSEALLGVQFPLTHLDGRILIISNSIETSPNIKKRHNSRKQKDSKSNLTYILPEVIQNGHTMIVEGEGMPCKNSPFKKGDLFIHFDVKFPISNDNFTKEFCYLLDKTFPKSKDSESLDLEEEEEAYEVTLLDSNIDEFYNSKRSYNPDRNEAYRDSSSENNSDDGYHFYFF